MSTLASLLWWDYCTIILWIMSLILYGWYNPTRLYTKYVVGGGVLENVRMNSLSKELTTQLELKISTLVTKKYYAINIYVALLSSIATFLYAWEYSDVVSATYPGIEGFYWTALILILGYIIVYPIYQYRTTNQTERDFNWSPIAFTVRIGARRTIPVVELIDNRTLTYELIWTTVISISLLTFVGFIVGVI